MKICCNDSLLWKHSQQPLFSDNIGTHLLSLGPAPQMWRYEVTVIVSVK